MSFLNYLMIFSDWNRKMTRCYKYVTNWSAINSVFAFAIKIMLLEFGHYYSKPIVAPL